MVSMKLWRYCWVLFILLTGTRITAGNILVQDSMEGLQINQLYAADTDESATYTVNKTVASPFALPVFGINTACGYLNDQSTVKTPYLLHNTINETIDDNDWVHVEFDICPVSGDYNQWQYCIGESTAWPYSCQINMQGSSFAVYGRYSLNDSRGYITIPGITVQAGDWYHFDIMFRPSAYSAGQRTYSITVTRDSNGTRTSGFLCGIQQEDSSPPQKLMIQRIIDSTTSYTGSILVDNVIMEKLNPATKIIDGIEGDVLNPLMSYATDGNSSFSIDTSQASPFLSSPVFMNSNSQCGLLDDQSVDTTPYLKSDGFADSALRYTYLQYDFQLVSDDFDQWQYYLGENGSWPFAFELRINNSNMVVFGRRKTDETFQLLQIPNISIVAGDWYHVEVLLKPVALPASQRTYDITVSQNSSGTITRGSVSGVLQEDANPVNSFWVRHITDGINSRTGQIRIDNVLLQTLGFGENNDLDYVDFRYGYFPSYNKLRYLLTGSWPTAVSDWTIQLIRNSDNSVLAENYGIFPFSQCGETLTIPTLTAGDYTLKTTLSGGAFSQDIIREFRHNEMPWVNSAAGLDDILVPPFTAMQVAGNDVSCILRTYTMGTSGLWNQLNSQNTDMLGSPISLKITANGQTYTASGSGVNFTTQTDTKVAGNAVWSAGPIVNARTDFEYDYDGLMLVTLNLPETASAVDELYLEIPLKESEAEYVYAQTDSIRCNPPVTIPAGSGEVWNSSSLVRQRLPGPFCSYIWTGGAERGICWFAENDKDWILDPDTPVLSITRSSTVTTLKIKFITSSSILTRERSIKFGLMGTPAKPKPEIPQPWRTWNPIETSATTADLNVLFLGAGYYWGTQTAWHQFYPAFYNYSIFDEFLQTRTSGLKNDDFITEWLTQFSDPIYDAYREAIYRPHLNYSLSLLCKDIMRSGGAPLQDVAKDGLEGSTLNPLVAYSTDNDATWQTDTVNTSPFCPLEFGTSTVSGLLDDQSSAVTPYIQTTNFNISSSDYLNIQLDLCPVSGEYDQWGITAGENGWWPFACELRIDQNNKFYVRGRRSTSAAYENIELPDLTISPGNWYHIDIILSPSSYPADKRTYTLTITEDAAGTRRSSTVRGILQEDATPTNLLRIWHYWTANHDRSGAIQVDNVIVRTTKPRSLLSSYTNPRAMVWDNAAETYLDEWSIYDIADPDWKSFIANGRRLLREDSANYDAFSSVPTEADPVASYVDQALYYHRKMYDTYADGIYWDNFFLQTNYNPVSGPGYIADDGTLRPGVNILGFRNLVRRHAVMQHKMHMPLHSWVHMTSVNIIPMVSFAGINYCWEWDGFTPGANLQMDAQDRYDLDDSSAYMFAVTSGIHSGTTPVIIDMFNNTDPTISEWLHRTALASCLPYEVKIKSSNALVKDTINKLTVWGYGTSDCTVYRFWDTVYPITLSGTAENIKALVLKRPDKAYVILGSFGDSGNCDFTIDLNELNLASSCTAVDDETDLPVTKLGTGQFRIFIDKHDFKLIRIE